MRAWLARRSVRTPGASTRCRISAYLRPTTREAPPIRLLHPYFPYDRDRGGLFSDRPEQLQHERLPLQCAARKDVPHVSRRTGEYQYTIDRCCNDDEARERAEPALRRSETSPSLDFLVLSRCRR